MYVLFKISFYHYIDACQSNVLVDSSGHARIADLGLAMLVKDEEDSSSAHGHTLRWTAPEVLDQGTYSKGADIFAFAMVMVEVRNCGQSIASTYCYFM